MAVGPVITDELIPSPTDLPGPAVPDPLGPAPMLPLAGAPPIELFPPPITAAETCATGNNIAPQAVTHANILDFSEILMAAS